jgi:DNA polymerase-3 subunit epsilon
MIHVDRRISRQAQKIHGISNGMLIGNPEPEKILPLFSEYIADSILVAHNAQFDVKFLRHEFGRLGISLSNRYICTLEMSRRRFPYLPDYRLETVCRHLFGTEEGCQLHRALDDARLVARVWMEMEGVSLPPSPLAGEGRGEGE